MRHNLENTAGNIRYSTKIPKKYQWSSYLPKVNTLPDDFTTWVLNSTTENHFKPVWSLSEWPKTGNFSGQTALISFVLVHICLFAHFIKQKKIELVAKYLNISIKRLYIMSGSPNKGENMDKNQRTAFLDVLQLATVLTVLNK